MALIECQNCGGTWFCTESTYQMDDEVLEPSGEPGIVSHKYLYRCIDCRVDLAMPELREEPVGS